MFQPMLDEGKMAFDIVDTGLVLRLREALAVLDDRLKRLIGTLRALAGAHKQTLMAARPPGSGFLLPSPHERSHDRDR